MTPDRREIWLRLVEAATRGGIPARYAVEGADELLRAMDERFDGPTDVQLLERHMDERLDEAEREQRELRAQLAEYEEPPA